MVFNSKNVVDKYAELSKIIIRCFAVEALSFRGMYPEDTQIKEADASYQAYEHLFEDVMSSLRGVQQTNSALIVFLTEQVLLAVKSSIYCRLYFKNKDKCLAAAELLFKHVIREMMQDGSSNK